MKVVPQEFEPVLCKKQRAGFFDSSLLAFQTGEQKWKKEETVL
jgi:hypothetical protein